MLSQINHPHIDAIDSFIRNNGQVESEPIEGRLHDLIVYCFLLLGLIEEQTAKDEAEVGQLRQRGSEALAAIAREVQQKPPLPRKRAANKPDLVSKS